MGLSQSDRPLRETLESQREPIVDLDEQALPSKQEKNKAASGLVLIRKCRRLTAESRLLFRSRFSGVRLSRGTVGKPFAQVMHHFIEGIGFLIHFGVAID